MLKLNLATLLPCVAIYLLLQGAIDVRNAGAEDLTSVYVPLTGVLELSKASYLIGDVELKTIEDFKSISEKAFLHQISGSLNEDLSFFKELSSSQPVTDIGWTRVRVAFDAGKFSESLIEGSDEQLRVLRTGKADVVVSQHPKSGKQITHQPSGTFSYFESSASRLYSRNREWFGPGWADEGESLNLLFFSRPLGAGRCMVAIPKSKGDSVVSRCFYGTNSDGTVSNISTCAIHLNLQPLPHIENVYLPSRTYLLSKISRAPGWLAFVYNIHQATLDRPVEAIEFEQSVLPEDLLVTSNDGVNTTNAFRPSEKIDDTAKKTTVEIEQAQASDSDSDRPQFVFGIVRTTVAMMLIAIVAFVAYSYRSRSISS